MPPHFIWVAHEYRHTDREPETREPYCLVFPHGCCIREDLREYRLVLAVSRSAKSALGPIADLHWTGQLVELTADFHSKLLDLLPVFLPLNFIVDQRANVVA